MTDIEFAAQIVACIKVFDSPYQALEKVRAYPVPHKSRKLKKTAFKDYSYIYFYHRAGLTVCS